MRLGQPISGTEMKILFVCHRFPFPPNEGGKIRAFHMVRHLAKSNDVTVASLARNREEADAGVGIREFIARYDVDVIGRVTQAIQMVARLPTSVPSSMGCFYSASLAARLQGLLCDERFDLIVVHCSSAAQYVEHVRNVPKILDFCDMDSQKWLEYARYRKFPLSAGYWLEGVKMEREESRLARLFETSTVATKEELKTLSRLGAGMNSDWFANGVDSDYFSPTEEPYDPDTISFVGRMDYYPNQECMFDFCANTLPAIRARRPGVKLVIAGAEPSSKVRQLGRLPGVTVTGFVPDVRPYVRKSAVMVAPLNIARGTQNKILEAMAMGVPVVSSEVAAGGVDATAGEHFLVGREPQHYADAILQIMSDGGLRARLATAGRERMLSHHSWPRSMQRLDGIIERCLTTWNRRSNDGCAYQEAHRDEHQ